MTLDDVLGQLFPGGHDIRRTDGCLVIGKGPLNDGGSIAVIGAVDGAPLAPEGLLPLAQNVLETVEKGGSTPILVLVDTAGQLMARRAEMLGLNEYLAHLAKCLLLASQLGHRTVGLVYGKAAAGAFLATALATDILVAVPGAEPAVMDLPSMARITKLPEAKLRDMATTTAVFAPGLDYFARTGGIARIFAADEALDAQLAQALADASPEDRRDLLGAEREGRPVAAAVAQRVVAAITGAHGS